MWKRVLSAFGIGVSLGCATLVLAIEPAASEDAPSWPTFAMRSNGHFRCSSGHRPGRLTSEGVLTCHSQALPVFASVASKRHGFTASESNLRRQIEHTYEHLRRGKQSYEQGKGQGGGVDTAGYALWTLEEGDWPPDDITAIVVDWLLEKQNKDGYWKHSSNRPPSEASEFTATYLALRALNAFGSGGDQDSIDGATSDAARWLIEAKASDTEDQVFRLLSFEYADVPSDVVAGAVKRLKARSKRRRRLGAVARHGERCLRDGNRSLCLASYWIHR